MDALLRRLTRTGFRRGAAGSRSWLIIAISLSGLRVLQRLARREEEILYRTVVRPGDVFEIDAHPPPG